MAIPTAWELLIPNWNIATVIGVVLIIIAIFGGPIFRLLGTLISRLSNGKVRPGIIVSLLVTVGLILIWGVSIVQDIMQSNELLLIMAGFIFLVAIVIILSTDKK